MELVGKKKIISGALTLGAGAMLAKVLGAIYRIPLTNLLGSYGLGLYQTVFPVYTVLLDFSGAGVPSAVSKIISSESGENIEKTAYDYLRCSLRLLFFLGVISTAIMAVFSPLISRLQGNDSATLAYVFLSPAIFFVSIISCFRGYFQGLMNMTPTAVSQVVEQVIKLVFGLIAVKLLMPNVTLAVAGATFAITLSEIAGALYLYIEYRRRKKIHGLRFNFDKSKFIPRAKKVIKTTVPITLIGIMLPLSHVADSFIIVNVLKTYRADATSLFGLLSGAANTVINLPVALCYGIATVAIPAVSSAKDKSDKKRNAVRTILLTIAVSLPLALSCFTFAPFIIRVLFRSLSLAERQTAVGLLRALSPSIVFLSLLQTENAVLIGKGKLYLPIISLSVGVAIKITLSLILLKNPLLNIYGGAIAVNACYFTVCLINLIITFTTKKVKDADKRA